MSRVLSFFKILAVHYVRHKAPHSSTFSSYRGGNFCQSSSPSHRRSNWSKWPKSRIFSEPYFTSAHGPHFKDQWEYLSTLLPPVPRCLWPLSVPQVHMPKQGPGFVFWRSMVYIIVYSKPVNSKKINPEYSLERLIMKLQYFGHLTGRADSLEKTLMLGKIKGKGE